MDQNSFIALPGLELDVELPDPEDLGLSDQDFLSKVDLAWQVCERFDLQTEIWRGRILRTVRDREKQQGDSRGQGFLRWLQEQEISKTRAYSLIELANSADTLLSSGALPAAAVERFSKRAFVETAQAPPEVQEMVTTAANRGERITYREVKQINDEWTTLQSDILPPIIKEKAADRSLSPRYLAPLVKELEKLPLEQQTSLQAEVAQTPDVDTIKLVTAAARSLSRYLESAPQIQALSQLELDLTQALGEAQRLGQLQSAADLVQQAAQLETTIARLYTTWKRLSYLAEQLYVESGSSTPHLRQLLTGLETLSGDLLEIQLGQGDKARMVRIHILPDEG
ncbi:hypothetical protein [Synechococcus sp. PCC 6312]|uniref:hypothetical protein n=1 Tax=Synechococcus sp. (strain ATCC 27167 / PCC 6312) TaxID=195253 RepID=UPI00029F0E0A|nr:hypothetical protein [Synechococcus sp. PCC 6312]AFY61058.1 hypothetical protein Syn6312_1919 [Synechococcus sp. PCC 6312]